MTVHAQLNVTAWLLHSWVTLHGAVSQVHNFPACGFSNCRSSSIVRHGAVTVLCGRLLAIEYIDLAEQSLQALEKLSYEHPQVRRG